MPMCGALRLSPVRASKNDFVGIAEAPSSGAAPWAKVGIAQPRQSNDAYNATQKNNLRMTNLPRYINTRNDTSFVSFHGSGGTKERIALDRCSPALRTWQAPRASR